MKKTQKTGKYGLTHHNYIKYKLLDNNEKTKQNHLVIVAAVFRMNTNRETVQFIVTHTWSQLNHVLSLKKQV